jgi:hypothetical protein
MLLLLLLPLLLRRLTLLSCQLPGPCLRHDEPALMLWLLLLPLLRMLTLLFCQLPGPCLHQHMNKRSFFACVYCSPLMLRRLMLLSCQLPGAALSCAHSAWLAAPTWTTQPSQHSLHSAAHSNSRIPSSSSRQRIRRLRSLCLMNAQQLATQGCWQSSALRGSCVCCRCVAADGSQMRRYWQLCSAARWKFSA